MIPAIAPRYGGPSYAVYQMCDYLQQRGIQPLIVTTDADGAGVLSVQLGSIISYQRVPTIFFRRNFSEAIKYSRRLAGWLAEKVKEFDVVHIHAVFSHACLAAARACRRAGVPYVVRPLGTLDPWSLQQKRWRKALFWQVGAKRMLADAAAVHYTTNEERRLAEESLHLQRGVVIPLGIDEALFQIVKPQGLATVPYVLTMGRLHPKKRLELLIESFLEVTRHAELASCQLVIAGDGEADYVMSLRQLAARLGCDERIIFSGWLAGEKKREMLQRADLFALISHQENFGIAAAEALACGVPVLLSEQVNLAAAVTEAGAGWVTSVEKNKLTAALSEALRDEQQRRERGMAARKLAERDYRWAAVAERLISLYEQMSPHTKRLR